MKQVIVACLLFGLVVLAFGLEKKEEESDPFDVIVDKEVKKVGEEAVLVGQILRECAKGLEVRAPKHEPLDNETAEYFFKKLWRKVKRGLAEAGKFVVKVGKGIVETTVPDVIKGVIKKKLDIYALAEYKSSGGLVLALAKDMDDLGKALIEKGVHLCGACRMKKLGDAEKSFVEGFVSAF